MLNLRHRIVAAGLLVAFAGAAQAQQAPVTEIERQGHGHAHASGVADPAQRQAHRARRLTDLKAQLQLTPAQEAAWATFAASMQPTGRPQRPDLAQLQKLTTPQRIDRMRELRAPRMAAQDRRADAVKSFYASLNPTQQRTFDAQPLPKRHRGHSPHQGGAKAGEAAG